jgi:hypothetical protein
MHRSTAVVVSGLLFFGVSLQVTAQESPGAKPSYRVLGQDKGKVAIVAAAGSIEWDYPSKFVAHDIARLPNGNIMFQSGPATIVEVSPSKEVVWKFTSKPKEGYTGAIEIHGFQRLENGLTLVSETGNRRLIEVDRDGKIVREVPLTIDRPNSHRDTRIARKLATGNYLVCHEGDGVVREYDPSGKVVWSYALDLNNQPRTPNHDGHGKEVFNALRKADGNTLIAAGNGNRVIEVSPEGKIVWSIERDELPGIHLCWVTTLKLLPNGNLIFGNTHAGPNNPQLVEVTRDKKVVWTFKNFETFGNDLCAALVLE